MLHPITMERSNLSFNFISWHLFIISLFICTFTAKSTQITSGPLEDTVCALINCGQGKCVASNASLAGFECDCNPGWKKIQIGPLNFPTCVVPNCTLNFQCDNGAPPPPQLPPSLPRPLNISDPCNQVWCGEGKCVAKGTGHGCQCYEGSSNLFDSSENACLKECSLGPDCDGPGVGLTTPPPTPLQLSRPPPPPTSGSTDKGMVCALINCGQGQCVASNASMVGFECDCNPGWKKIQIGPLTFPTCVVPDCTIDFECDNGAPSPPPPPSALPRSLNISDPCNQVWCGEGKCVASGTGHACQCYEGSSNLFDSPQNACLKECSLGRDCDGIGVGMARPPPPPPRTGLVSTDEGSNEVANSSTNLQAITTILLAVTILTWIYIID